MQKVSDFLDKINTAMISDMAVDCVCCESLDVAQIELFNLTTNKFLLSKATLAFKKTFYTSHAKALLPYSRQVRAPPIV